MEGQMMENMKVLQQMRQANRRILNEYTNAGSMANNDSRNANAVERTIQNVAQNQCHHNRADLMSPPSRNSTLSSLLQKTPSNGQHPAQVVVQQPNSSRHASSRKNIPRKRKPADPARQPEIATARRSPAMSSGSPSSLSGDRGSPQQHYPQSPSPSHERLLGLANGQVDESKFNQYATVLTNLNRSFVECQQNTGDALQDDRQDTPQEYLARFLRDPELKKMIANYQKLMPTMSREIMSTTDGGTIPLSSPTRQLLNQDAKIPAYPGIGALSFPLIQQMFSAMGLHENGKNGKGPSHDHLLGAATNFLYKGNPLFEILRNTYLNHLGHPENTEEFPTCVANGSPGSKDGVPNKRKTMGEQLKGILIDNQRLCDADSCSSCDSEPVDLSNKQGRPQVARKRSSNGEFNDADLGGATVAQRSLTTRCSSNRTHNRKPASNDADTKPGPQPMKSVGMTGNNVGNKTCRLTKSFCHREYVTIPTKFTPVVSTRLNDWLTHLNRGVLETLRGLDVISNDKALTLSRCWHRLLITFMIDNDFQCVVCKVDDKQSCNSQQRDSGVGLSMRLAQLYPTRDDVDRLQAMVSKGHDLKINEETMRTVRNVLLLKEATDVVDNNNALKELSNRTQLKLQREVEMQRSKLANESKQSGTGQTPTHQLPAASSSYSRILLFLTTLYSADCDAMERLFWQYIGGSTYQTPADYFQHLFSTNE